MGGKNEQASRNPNRPLSRREQEAIRREQEANRVIMNRRLFLKIGGGVIGATALGVAGFVYRAENSGGMQANSLPPTPDANALRIAQVLDSEQRQYYKEATTPPKQHGEVTVEERIMDYFNWTDSIFDEQAFKDRAIFIKDYAKRSGLQGSFPAPGGDIHINVTPVQPDGVNKSLVFVAPRTQAYPDWSTRGVLGTNFYGYTIGDQAVSGLWKTIISEPTPSILQNGTLPKLNTTELDLTHTLTTELIQNFHNVLSDVPANQGLAQEIWAQSFSTMLMYRSLPKVSHEEYINNIKGRTMNLGTIHPAYIGLPAEDFNHAPVFPPIFRKK